MEFQCEDLPEVGLRLFPPERNKSALPTLLNLNDKAVAAVSVIWNYQGLDGWTSSASFLWGVGAVPSLLLPFGLTEKRRRQCAYWDVILHGSKRLVGNRGLIGDNTDVRPPTPDEDLSRACWGLGSGGERHIPDRLKSVKLTLDGVFFADGEFVGPNEGGLWEEIVYTAEVHQEVGKVARRAHASGKAADDVLAEVERVIGPADEMPPPPCRGGLDPEKFRSSARAFLSQRISMARQHTTIDETVHMLVQWADAVLLDYRRVS